MNTYKITLKDKTSFTVDSMSFEYNSDFIVFFDFNEQFGQSNKFMFDMTKIEQVETIKTV